jgi:hypothetical protein
MVGYRRRIHEGNVTSNVPQMYMEVAIVIARLLAEHPELAERVTEAAKQRLAAMAYWFREGQRYKESVRVYRLLTELGESRQQSALALLKVQCHRLLSAVLRWEPVETCITERVAAGSQPHLRRSASL